MHRVDQILLLVGAAAISWLGMMAVHELGHVLGAAMTGGTVRQVVLHPLVISRTDVEPNPSPLIVVLAGPIVGVIIPIGLACSAQLLRWRAAFLLWFFGGFCMIANGAYIGIGIGVFDEVGDAGEMLRLGSPRWSMILFGASCAAGGFYIWHRISPRFGFGRQPIPIEPRHASFVLGTAVVVYGLASIFGNAGN